ncbi:MAG: DISARM system phospholipase D-like protein DrmC [Candidatus Hodarchaeales archaeon]|jgi:phosphatidylserine/phosphatidylglycerophosphate/cardiolipin synthase-like enzyme
MSDKLITQIIKIVHELPNDIVQYLISEIKNCDSQNYNVIKSQILDTTPQSEYRAEIINLFDIWQQIFPSLTSKEIAFAVSTAATFASQERAKQSLELVWTGPNPQNKPFRRTEQALIEIIDSSVKTLTIVSFVIYKAGRIRESLTKAANRAVEMKFILESPHESDGKIAYSNIDALGQEVRSKAQFFVWPMEARPKDSSGKYGSLHVKCMVGDSNKAFLSSANLTEYAFMLNMELGLLVKGGAIPKDIEEQIKSLILHDIIVPFNQ